MPTGPEGWFHLIPKARNHPLLEEAGLRFRADYDFNLFKKHVRIDTAVPGDFDKLTSQVIDDTLDGSLSGTPDQPFVGPDFFRGATSHAVLAQVDHLRTPPSDSHVNPLTIFVYLDDRITPTQLRFNMSQLVRNFRRVWITPSERLI
jgi:hypothetical protein